MKMIYPELFQNTNNISTKHAAEFLQKYAHKIKWNPNGDTIIDLGSGDGGTTGNILRRFIPKNYKQLVGCDVSEEMVTFANKHHGDERTKFILMDIEAELPIEQKESFDHVFSFYLLHWIQDQETTFSNAYKLLKNGGVCLQLFFGHMPIYNGFRALSKLSKWSSWLTDIHRFVSVYQDLEKPEDLVREIMEKTGFKNIEISCHDTSHTFKAVDDFINLIEAVNPYVMPSEVKEEFLKDYRKITLEMKLLKPVENGFMIEYSLVEAYGTK